MRTLDTIIVSCDDNPAYAEWWPLVSILLHRQTGIAPTLLYVGDKHPADVIRNPGGFPIERLRIDPPGGSRLARATISRLWYAARLPAETAFTFWDMDLLPLAGGRIVELPHAGPQRVLSFETYYDWMLASGYAATAGELEERLATAGSGAVGVKFSVFAAAWCARYSQLHTAYFRNANSFFGLDEMILNAVTRGTAANCREMVPRRFLRNSDKAILQDEANAAGLVAWHPALHKRGLRENAAVIARMLDAWGHGDLKGLLPC